MPKFSPSSPSFNTSTLVRSFRGRWTLLLLNLNSQFIWRINQSLQPLGGTFRYLAQRSVQQRLGLRLRMRRLLEPVFPIPTYLESQVDQRPDLAHLSQALGPHLYQLCARLGRSLVMDLAAEINPTHFAMIGFGWSMRPPL